MKARKNYKLGETVLHDCGGNHRLSVRSTILIRDSTRNSLVNHHLSSSRDKKLRTQHNSHSTPLIFDFHSHEAYLGIVQEVT